MTGEPELPPMMSHVDTKLNGVFRFTMSFAAAQRFGSSNGYWFLRSSERL